MRRYTTALQSAILMSYLPTLRAGDDDDDPGSDTVRGSNVSHTLSDFAQEVPLSYPSRPFPLASTIVSWPGYHV